MKTGYKKTGYKKTELSIIPIKATFIIFLEFKLYKMNEIYVSAYLTFPW